MSNETPLMTGLFPDRESAERGYSALSETSLRSLAPRAPTLVPDWLVSRNSGGSHKWEPPFFRSRSHGTVTWLITGTLVLLAILAAAPLLHGRWPHGTTGPFAKD